ncbi:MAG: hypothetical protein LBS58_04690, partial [Coriobacteriales bacterium]|nr:hypothetical protein [Coriobacteriales bacterium]
GTLNILGNQNDHFNVETDIYVKNGGTLTIQAGAMIKGNIYCYGGGTVKVLGNFTLQGHTITTGEGTFPGGIFIYGEKSVALDAPDMLLGAGNFEATANITISGSDGVDDFKVTGSGTTRGPAVHFFSATLFKDAKYALYACSDHDPVTNQCRHSGNSISTATAGGSWTFGDYS